MPTKSSTIKDLEIDAETSYWININYYKNHEEIRFITESMGRAYPAAVAHFLSSYFASSEIEVLETGARGIYFWQNMSEALKNINPLLYNNMYYTLSDISPVAVSSAQEEASFLQNGRNANISFLVLDVLGEMPNKLYDAVIMNELLDDLPQMVVARQNGRYYEVVYKVVFDRNYGEIRLAKGALRRLSWREEEKVKKEVNIEEGRAATYSPLMRKVVENVGKIIQENGAWLIHDYFIRAPAPLKYASELKRIYGDLMPEVLFQNAGSAEVQITADVNLIQLGDALQEKGFEVNAYPHTIFLDEMLGEMHISIGELAFSLNSLSQKEKKELLSRLGRSVEGRGRDEINEAILEEVKKVFRDDIRLKNGHFVGRSKVYELKVLDGAEAFYDLVRSNYGVKNPFMDVIAEKE